VSARPIGVRLVGRDDRVAEQNRALLNASRIFSINLIAAPGSGTSSLVRRTAEALGRAARVAVLTTRPEPSDSGHPLTLQVDSQSSRHVTSAALAAALPRLDLAALDFLIVKNVSDFVCPATYRLGTHVNVRLATVLERDGRPRDEPQLFEGLDALVVNKLDRLGESAFDVARFRTGIDALNPNLFVFALSCASGTGVDAWVDWLMRRRTAQFYRGRT
jgi:hydrogenase nickel incorporation protein HypB